MSKKGDLYKQYLDQKHSQFNTSDEIIAEEIHKATNSLPRTKERIVLGENSEVYKIKTGDGQKVIIRISRREDPRFEAERWAIEQAKMQGVPTPNILLTDRIVSNGEKLDINVEEQIEGELLSILVPKLSQDELHSFANKAGEILSKINAVETTGFGYLDENGVGKYTSWIEFTSSLVNKKEKLAAAAKRVGYDTEKIKNAITILENNMDTFEDIKSQLLHSDFGPKHLFISEKEIVGVIDFESCKGGDPIREFAWWDYFWGDRVPVTWLLEGYLDKDFLNHPTFGKRFALTKLHLGLGMLEYYEMEKNQYGIDYSKKQLDKMMERLI